MLLLLWQWKPILCWLSRDVAWFLSYFLNYNISYGIILEINSWQVIRERIGMKFISPPTQILTNWQKILNTSACHSALTQKESNSLWSCLVPKHQNEFWQSYLFLCGFAFLAGCMCMCVCVCVCERERERETLSLSLSHSPPVYIDACRKCIVSIPLFTCNQNSHSSCPKFWKVSHCSAPCLL